MRTTAYYFSCIVLFCLGVGVGFTAVWTTPTAWAIGRMYRCSGKIVGAIIHDFHSHHYEGIGLLLF